MIETNQAPRFSPQPAQKRFLETNADIAVYGGSAGGGKSWALLYDPIRHFQVSGFHGVVFRRTYPEITNPGGLWDEASGLYPWLGGDGLIGACEWRFPSWSTKIAFRHLENEATKYAYQGSAICYLAFDELTHFSQSQFWYLYSRNRSKCGVRPYVRATCNPNPGWVKEFLAPWVDTEWDGLRAASGELRWFIRLGGEIKWVPPSTPRAKSVTFIRASIYDNQYLLDKDPDYLATLMALPPVERARLLDGDWNVRREGLVYPGFDLCITDAAGGIDRSEERRMVPLVGGIDFGFHNPFAAVSGFLDHDDVLWITRLRYQSNCTLPLHSDHLPKGVKWQADPAGAGQIVELRQAGHDVRPCVHIPTRGAGGEKKNPKLSGIDMVSERIRTGRLRIVRSPEMMPLIRELGMYHYDELKSVEEPVDEHNHACDALRYLIVGLDRGKVVPPLTPPESAAARTAREAAEQKADLDRRKAEDDNRERDMWNDKYFGGGMI
jgi:phage terminase large subunit